MLAEIFQYGFIVRGLEAGIIMALIAPVIGTFMVLKRYSLIADTLAHVSLAGIAVGLLFGLNPIVTAVTAGLLASLGIDRLSRSKKIYGESALSLFLSGSLALALVILSFGRGINANLLNYLFGSIVTVTNKDVLIIATLAIFVLTTTAIFFKELVYATFDEEAAKISGVKTGLVNIVLIILAALTVSLSIPIVGVLMIAALLVIPAVTALQFRRSFLSTLLIAEAISLFSVIAGILAAFYLNLATSGMIVIIMLAIFTTVFAAKRQ